MSTRPSRLQLPGFGLAIDSRHLTLGLQYRHALEYGCLSDGVTVRERRMLQFMNQITDKVGWEQKVFDEQIVARWKDEACVWDGELGEEFLSERMFDFCILELQENTQRYKETGQVTILNCELGIVKSDTAVSHSLKQSLRQCVALLENKSAQDKDWHPGSDEMVLDLLHPSLFPIIYGKSRALPYGTVPLENCAAFIGKGEPVEQPFERSGDAQRRDYHWGNFQWLPSDIKFDEEGKPRIVSYINNLHPQTHRDVYTVLEELVAAAIPLWDECFAWDDVRNIRMNMKDVVFSEEDYFVPESVRFHPSDTGRESIKANGFESTGIDLDKGLTLKQLRGTDLWYEDGGRDWFEAIRILKPIEPRDFNDRPPESEPDRSKVLQSECRDYGMQVIFKLANIHLTPEKPEYNGGSWHIEGALNEMICATALYYFDQDNITESRLAFRQQLDESELGTQPAQDEYESLEAYYGVKNEEAAIQVLGSVLTREDRFLAFPNILQHQVQPFRLVESTRTGQRKILAMFLVDPTRRVLSTANVPPQRKDWWSPEVRKVPPFDRLPMEIFEMIVGFVDGFPMTWEEAVDARQDLMDERGALIDRNNDEWDESTFFFCEH